MDEITELQQVARKITEIEHSYDKKCATISESRRVRDERQFDLDRQKEDAQRVVEERRQALAVAEETLAAINDVINGEPRHTESDDEREDTKMAADHKQSLLELRARWAELRMAQDFGTPLRETLIRSSVSRSSTPQQKNLAFTAVQATSSLPPQAPLNSLPANYAQNSPVPASTDVAPHTINTPQPVKIENPVKPEQNTPTVPTNVSGSAPSHQPASNGLDEESLWSEHSEEGPLSATRRRSRKSFDVEKQTEAGNSASTAAIAKEPSNNDFGNAPRIIKRLSDKPLTMDIINLEGLDSVTEHPSYSGSYYTFWCGECQMRLNNVRGASTHLRASPQHSQMTHKKSSFAEAIQSLGTQLTGVTEESLKAHDKKYAAALIKEKETVDSLDFMVRRDTSKKSLSPKVAKKDVIVDSSASVAPPAVLDDAKKPSPVKRPMGPSRADPAIQKKFTDLALHKSLKRANSASTESPGKRSKTESLIQRPPVTWFYEGLPSISPSIGEPQWNEMKFFTGTFLKEVLNLPDNMPGGWVIPNVEDSEKKQLVSTNGPIWLAKVSTNPLLPYKIGSHGLYYQYVKPMRANYVVPLFVSERADHAEKMWYCGHYQAEDGVLSVPITPPEADSMRTLSHRILKQLRRDVKKGRNPAEMFPWKREEIRKLTEDEFYNSMMPGPNNLPPPLPCYKRRLVFHYFNKDFYNDLVAEKTRWDNDSLVAENAKWDNDSLVAEKAKWEI